MKIYLRKKERFDLACIFEGRPIDHLSPPFLQDQIKKSFSQVGLDCFMTNNLKHSFYHQHD